MPRIRLWSPVWLALAPLLALLPLLGTQPRKPATSQGGFIAYLPASFHVPANAAQQKLLAAYGAMFVARGVQLPPTVIFPDAAACDRWQARVPRMKHTVAGSTIELQSTAMRALLAAEREARRQGLTISPRGGDAAARDYQQTLRLWRSRVRPGLRYWVRRGRLQAARAKAIRALPVAKQVSAILQLESRGLYFSLDRHKTILESVAAPGASQHLALLALDVRENGDARVRAILNRQGWFQTVVSDTPHFTYLGRPAAQLPQVGLRVVRNGGRRYWVPRLTPAALQAAAQ